MSQLEIVVKDNVITAPAPPLPELEGLGSTYFYKMKQFKNEIAQTDAVTGEEHTYELVLKKSVRAAIAMRSKGLKSEDVITICSENHMDVIIPHYAGLFLGAISANLDPLLPLSDSVYLLKLVRPKMIFVQPEAVEHMENALKEAKLDSLIIVFGNLPNYTNFSEFLANSPDEDNFLPYEVQNVKDTAAIVFTSGSTGLPKGACLTHYGILGSIMQLKPLQAGTKILVYANLYWIAGLIFTTFLVLYGGNRVMYHRFDVNTVWEVLEKRKPNTTLLNPHQVIGMCAQGRPEGVDTSDLEILYLGGGPLSKETVLHVRKCFPNTLVLPSYGQTEQNGSTLQFDLIKDKHHFELKPDSVGRPRSGYSYKVVNTETEEVLGANKPGELRIKTDFCMKGYLHGISASDVWDSDGYMKTGDIAYYDEDFCFFVTGRIKDLMKYQMWHISPVNVESVLYKHPAVKECIVSSRPDEIDGDHLLGVVVLQSDFIGRITEKELESFVNERVGNQFKLRAGVKFVQSIPYTTTEKPDRILVKKLIIQGKI